MNDGAAEAASASADSPAAAAPAADSPAPSPAASLAVYYWIFAASGFAGLIYESVWTRYVKLLLGNAAGAQALVLAVFLVSLAVGAALCARASERLRRPLLWYAAAEAAVALVAVYFHDIFVAAQSWAEFSVLPALQTDFGVALFKWAFAAALIAPPTVLLGATFPLMSAGLARTRPRQPGRVVALLYFTNTLGGAAGVVASGFLFIPFLGLPGTVILAGFINAAVAAVVWGLSFRQEEAPPLTAAAAAPQNSPAAAAAKIPLQRLILAAAFITGAASFIYEIVWLRMLALLLGPINQVFELMLSAFILGLALGGLAARKIADASPDPLRPLAFVQLAMGAFALWPLFAFPLFYDILRVAVADLRGLGADGFAQYNLLAWGLSLLMMLPAAFCAGMTLPLLTRKLISAGGEQAIGRVYAANTLGAVAGTAAAVGLLLPAFGMQVSVVIGAGLDMALGAALFFAVAPVWKLERKFATAATAAAVAVALAFGGINPQIAAAGVFQHPGRALHEVPFWKNGKTALITVSERKKTRTIKTNGAINGGIFYAPLSEGEDKQYSLDELTTVFLALAPLLYRPDAETAMNIGFGTGLTSRALLTSPNLQRLDNVEIEPVMAEGARHLGPRVAPVFDDARNRFIFSDAKTELVRGGRGGDNKKYDIIISEPSSLWAGNTAGLFTKEFYARVSRALAAGGVFSQWLPLYDQSPQQVASAFTALAEIFPHLNAYVMERASMLVVAANEPLPPLQNDIFAVPAAAAFFNAYDFTSAADINAVLLGGGAVLAPYWQSFQAPANSDYAPYVEDAAFRSFFLRLSAIPFLGIPLLPVPILEFLGGRPPPALATASPQIHSFVRNKAANALRAYERREEAEGRVQQTLARLAAAPCPADADAADGGAEYQTAVTSLASLFMPVTEAGKMAEIWRMLEADECMQRLLALPGGAGAYMSFWRALSLRDAATVAQTAEALLPIANIAQPSGQTLLLAAAAANYNLGEYQKAVYLLLEMPQIIPAASAAARLIGSAAAAKI